MYTVIQTGGKQYAVQEGWTLCIEKINTPEKTIVFEGMRLCEGKTVAQKVTASVIESFRDKKVIVFKKKRRQNYRRKAGHRQGYMRIKIESLH